MGSSEHGSLFPDLRDRFIGVDCEVPLLDGSSTRYVNLDNAATTPPLSQVVDTVNRFLPYYSSVHRGTGFKSRLSTVVYDQAHEIIARFVGADPQTNTVIFGKNTTEAINKLSYRIALPPDAIVITTQMEHHSNDLPWRDRTNVIHVRATPDGRLDEDDFDHTLMKHAGQVALVCVTAASNVTGFVQPIHRLARKAHAVGARILVDAAQLAAHRRLEMKTDDDPEHLDFVALSGHKMYAPFGTGALIGPKEVFLQSGPEYSGGGTVDMVTMDEVSWAGVPDREESGSPNIVGAVAIAAAAQILMDLGMDDVAAHEDKLISYTLEQLRTVPNLRVYGQSDPAKSSEKVGVVPFNLDGMSHFKVAAILGYEAGIGVRSGCFCAHPYVVHLLQLSEDEQVTWHERVLNGNRTDLPGMVRASFGCYNDTEDIGRLIDMLKQVARGDYRGDYEVDPGSGDFIPKNYPERFSEYFLLLDEGNTSVGVHGPCGR